MWAATPTHRADDSGLLPDLFPLHFLLATIAGWVNRHQAQVIDCLMVGYLFGHEGFCQQGGTELLPLEIAMHWTFLPLEMAIEWMLLPLQMSISFMRTQALSLNHAS